jgi:hypothetical protein
MLLDYQIVTTSYKVLHSSCLDLLLFQPCFVLSARPIPRRTHTLTLHFILRYNDIAEVSRISKMERHVLTGILSGTRKCPSDFTESLRIAFRELTDLSNTNVKQRGPATKLTEYHFVVPETWLVLNKIEQELNQAQAQLQSA